MRRSIRPLSGIERLSVGVRSLLPVGELARLAAGVADAPAVEVFALGADQARVPHRLLVVLVEGEGLLLLHQVAVLVATVVAELDLDEGDRVLLEVGEAVDLEVRGS